jgi:hypothetical protein
MTHGRYVRRVAFGILGAFILTSSGLPYPASAGDSPATSVKQTHKTKTTKKHSAQTRNSAASSNASTQTPPGDGSMPGYRNDYQPGMSGY